MCQAPTPASFVRFAQEKIIDSSNAKKINFCIHLVLYMYVTVVEIIYSAKAICGI